MYELNQVSQHCYTIECPARIGLVEIGEGEVCLIDSGSDKDAGRRVRQILDAHHWRLKAIYNTHSHADHIGGNQYLQAQTGCRIYAPGMECDFTCHPVLEPSLLYGGCPPAGLKHKFLMAKPSCAEPLTDSVLPAGVRMLPLPGHSMDMVGFETEEGITYLADCVSSKATLEKYQIGFLYDVGAHLATLERVKKLEARLFVPSHAEAVEDIAPLAQLNQDKVLEIAERILGLCREPVSTEWILQGLFESYQLTMDVTQWALVGSTVRSYLAWMEGEGRVEAMICNHQLLWKGKE